VKKATGVSSTLKGS